MDTQQLAEIKALAIRLAYEIKPTEEIATILTDADIIYQYLIK
jgi:hypothetical protein